MTEKLDLVAIRANLGTDTTCCYASRNWVHDAACALLALAVAERSYRVASTNLTNYRQPRFAEDDDLKELQDAYHASKAALIAAGGVP